MVLKSKDVLYVELYVLSLLSAVKKKKKKHFPGKIIIITVEFSVVQTACLVEEASECLSLKFIQNGLRSK